MGTSRGYVWAGDYHVELIRQECEECGALEYVQAPSLATPAVTTFKDDYLLGLLCRDCYQKRMHTYWTQQIEEQG